MPRAAILDVDGTLVASNDVHVQAWVTAFTEAGLCAHYRNSIFARLAAASGLP